MSGASLNQRDDAAFATEASNGLSPAMVRRAIFASVLGNGLEWFDFLIYGYFAKIIALVFFPGGSGFVSIMLTLATFAVGFIVRPIGGILFGIYADRAGRRKALSLLIISMAASTLLMGLTPGYASIGIAAPLLVVLARLLQGLSVGGQFATASAMLVEYAPPHKKMFYGSFNMSAQAFALLLSSGVGYLLTTQLTHEQLGRGAGACRFCSARWRGRSVSTSGIAWRNRRSSGACSIKRISRRAQRCASSSTITETRRFARWA